MKIVIYSDMHLEFAPFYPPQGLESDVVVLAGDIRAPGSAVAYWARRDSVFGERPIVFVSGNHEFYGRVYERQCQEMQEQARRFLLHCLQQGSVVIDGVRFIGTTVWTDFALRIETDEGLASDVDRALQEARRMNDYRVIRKVEQEDSEPRHARLLRPQDTLEINVPPGTGLVAGRVAATLLRPDRGSHAPWRPTATRSAPDMRGTGCRRRSLASCRRSSSRCRCCGCMGTSTRPSTIGWEGIALSATRGGIRSG